MQQIPNELILMLLLVALAFAFFHLYRWIDEKSNTISSIEDDKERILLQIELSKATVQAVSIIGVAIGATLTWHQFAQSDDIKYRIETLKRAADIASKVDTAGISEKAASLIELDEYSKRYPDQITPTLTYYLKASFGDCLFDNNSKQTLELIARRISIKHSLQPNCAAPVRIRGIRQIPPNNTLQPTADRGG